MIKINCDKNISGVYIITNNITGKHYVGESETVRRRLLGHKNDLIGGRHNNIHLQRAFNKDGIENFTFDLLDECLPKNSFAMEHYWCILLNVHDDRYGYNIRRTSTDIKGHKHSIESKRKLSIAHKGKIISELHKKNMSIAQLNRDNEGGQYRSPEAKIKIAKTNMLRQKEVSQYSIDGKFIKKWDSRMQASKELKIGYSAICNATLGYRPTAGGFRWKF